MIKSMTGYGRGEALAGKKKIIAELRSLNSKQLDLSVKIPQMYRSKEYDIRLRVAKALQRGKVDLYIGYESEKETAQTAVNINGEAFAAYCQTISTLCYDNDMDWSSGEVRGAALSAILRMPDVSCSDVSMVPEDEIQAVISAVETAIADMDKFRTQEGDVLKNDLLGRVDMINKLMNSVTPYEKPRIDLIRNRLRENIETLNLSVDNNRLEQEIIYYVEKLDITEEKVRLANHCLYFHEVVASEEGVGRKLGFIAQEMGREINTMGSKANDTDIQRIVVQMKDELEKIKEQILNIL